MYSTDNGPHMNSWPDAGMTPFRNEKNSNWEGAYRVPAMVRWPGHIPAGSVSQRHRQPQRLVRHAASGGRGARHRRASCCTGTDLGGTTYKVHLDGHDQLAYITGETDESPREHFFYVSDDGDLTGAALRQLEVRVHGATLPRHPAGLGRAVHRAARSRSSSTCAPTRTSGPTSRRTPTTTGSSTTPSCSIPAQAYVGQMLQTFAEFPPRQKSASFSIDQVMAKLQDATTGSS